MYTRKKVVSSENVVPKGLEGGLKNQLPGKTLQGKVKRVGVGQVKRPALGDIANAEIEKLNVVDGKKKIPIAVKKTIPKTASTINAKPVVPAVTKPTVVPKKEVSARKEQKEHTNASKNLQKTRSFRILKQESEIESKDIDLDGSVLLDRVEEDISVIEEGDELLTFDHETYNDIFHVAIYAQDIFNYYKNREKMFDIPAYMKNGDYPVTPAMRAILVDWMVETQENFELNHETLYLGVKLTDMYLSRATVTKDELQLVGAVALFIASKFDEQRYPLIEDFTYVCDNAFDAHQFLEMEMSLLRQVDFDLGIPLSYRFLRRYAKVGKLSIQTLTLARFILELSLMDSEFISVRDSIVAAAALFLAMKMRNEGEWTGDLVKTSGYELNDFKKTLLNLNAMMLAPKNPNLNNSRCKYSHSVFHGVAKIPTIKSNKLFL